jgi:hypothetical protein
MLPAARSGLSANGFHGGDMPSLEGDGGSIWTADSLSRARATVQEVFVMWKVCLDMMQAQIVGGEAAGACV